MHLNTTTIKTSSEGAWQGDNPLNYAFPLLILQTTLVLSLTHFLAFLLKPLRQPKVIAEIIVPLGRNKQFVHLLFPSWSTPILESVGSIGLLFFLFLVGIELDLTSIRRSGKRAFTIALVGISLPFLFSVGVTFLLRKAVHNEDKVGYVQLLMFMGVALSITAFPVLARILAELKLLTTQVGETAMATAAFNDVAAWILLASTVAISGGDHKSPLVSIWILISGVAFVAFMLLLIRPVMNWVAQKCSSEYDFLHEAYICLTLLGVMISGFMTDLIGIHAIFGAFVFGLTIPKGGDFATRVIKRIEDFVSGLLLLLYFASSGLKTDVAKIHGAEAWGLLVLVISTACAGKILGTFVVAMLCMIPVRESLALGVLMNTKGLVELIVLNIGKEKKVLNDEIFAILVLMALFTTFMTTPTVMAIYKPLHGIYSQTNRPLQRQLPLTENSKDELRILACVHGPENVPSLINLVESIRNPNRSPLKLYVMHLVELTDRSSSIMMVQRARKNGFPFINRFRKGATQDQIAAAFETYAQVNRVNIRHSIAISALSTMQEDICHVAQEKRVAMIILPFHKLWRGKGEEAMENVNHGWRMVNQMVLKRAPCSVTVLVDRGFGCEPKQEAGPSTPMPKRVCILFFGGPDDREALELGGRMAEHPALRLTILRFLEKTGDEGMDQSHSCSTVPMNNEREKELDETAMAIRRWNQLVMYEERAVDNITEEVLKIGQSREYELVIVGKGQFPSSMGAKLPVNQIEHAELGLVGDILASSDCSIVPSVLVTQQQDEPNADETAASGMVQDMQVTTDDASITNTQPSV
ncbi:cation/H(+) antiporter 20-like [Fagus crenata]